MNYEKEWNNTELMQREITVSHRPLEDELLFYNAVKNGDLDYVSTNCMNHVFLNPEGMGLLSENPLQNLKYHFVITTAMITRYSIDGGMEAEKAYGLSDFYIQKMDKCQSKEEIAEIHQIMCFDFTRRMRQLGKSKVYSKHIVQCVDYIYNHIHSRITLKELAKHLDFYRKSWMSKPR